MKLVDTRSSKRTNVARTADGSVDFEAYVGLSGQIASDGLNVAVRVVGARARYGHLDLCVTPISGSGQRWIERKNVKLVNDPAEVLF